HKGKCYRSGISYNAALKRYLWCQTLPGGDARFKGGFGIYDAPQPWGPWTTAYFTEEGDVGTGGTSSFPTKWRSGSGQVLHLVSSGDDCFSVRQATLALASDRATVRVAGIVLKWVRGDREANYRRAEPLIREAARKGARVIVTTECFLDGYAIAD